MISHLDDDPEDSPLDRLSGVGEERLRHRLRKGYPPSRADALRSELFLQYWRRPWASRRGPGTGQTGFKSVRG